MHREIYKLLLFIIFIMFSSLAYAHHEDQDSPPDIVCQSGGKNGSGPAFGGKPISLYSGMETYAPSMDLTLGNLFPITITRSYNSRTSYDSPLGYGWAINYDKRLYTYPDGSVTVRKECGIKGRFTRNGSAYVGSSGDSGTLVQNADSTFTYTDKSGEKDNYDTRGRLLTRIDAKGNSLVFYYELDVRSPLWGLLPANINQTSPLIVAYDYRLSRIEEKDSSGSLTNRYVLFHYDSSTGRLTDIVDSNGRTVNYTHDGIGNLTVASGPNGSSTYGYTDTNNNHRLTSIDEGQGAYINTYDARGRVTRQTHGAGVIDFEYITVYKKTKMTTTIKDSSGNLLNTQTRTVEFDDNGMLVKLTDTFGNITTYVRDINTASILQERQFDIVTGITTTTAFTYDTKENILTKTEAQGTALAKTITWTYHPTFSKVLTETIKSVVNPAQNRVITNVYDESKGNLHTSTETGLLGNGTPYSYTTSYEYDANGRITKIDGPRTDVQDIVTYTYDPVSGFLTSITQPLIGTTTYSNHDGLGNPQNVTDPNGNSTTYTYDTTGRVLTVKAPGDSAASQYVYVSTGCSSCGGGGGANKIDYIILPEGNKIDYDYDLYGNLVKISDHAGNSINYTYDSEGNKLTEHIKDSGGSLQKSLSYSYDALNRLKRITNPDSSYTEYTYDFRNNKKSAKDPRNNTTNYGYDELGRLKNVSQPGSVDTLYGYDTNNNLTSVKDANNNTTLYKYDDKGRVYQVISPDTGTTTYAYDPAGNLTSKTDAKGVMITYTYDALNRLTTIDFPTDTDILYSYDTCPNGKGRLCSMTDASGTTSYEYTPKGQIKKEAKLINSFNYVTQYTYDQNGNMKTMTYPSGKVITYNYTNDRATSVLNGAANLATNITYKPFGGMNGITYGNGLASSIGYDTQYRLATLTTGTFQNLTYGYDFNGNVTSITPGKTYTYDALDRLATGTGSWGSLGWTYDGVGNRQTENANTYNYSPSTNKLTSANGISFGYDNNGNTISEASRVYTYNQNQRLIQVVDGAMTAGYTYNGNGQRVKKTVNGTVTIFHYSLSGQIIAESTSSGTVTAEYVYLNSQPLAKIEGSNVYYYHNDHLATPQKMTDSAGVVRWAADYKPFGEVNITTSEITNNLRFPGQYFDSETGLHNNYYRDYNPALGRYPQADPIGIRSGTNHLYVYVADNPIMLIDPDGLAYFAKRPLKGSSWKGSASCNPVDDYFNTEISHEQLFFEDGKSPSNVGFFDSDGGTLKTEPNPAGYQCKSGSFNDCIMRKAYQNVPSQPYCLLGKPGSVEKFNCQTWAEAVRKEYNKLANDPKIKCECKK